MSRASAVEADGPQARQNRRCLSHALFGFQVPELTTKSLRRLWGCGAAPPDAAASPATAGRDATSRTRDEEVAEDMIEGPADIFARVGVSESDVRLSVSVKATHRPARLKAPDEEGSRRRRR